MHTDSKSKIKEGLDPGLTDLRKGAYGHALFLSIIFLFLLQSIEPACLQSIKLGMDAALQDMMITRILVKDYANVILILLFFAVIIFQIFCIAKINLLFNEIHRMVLRTGIINSNKFLIPSDKKCDNLIVYYRDFKSILLPGSSESAGLFFIRHTATIFIFMLLTWNSPGIMLIFGLITIIMAIRLLRTYWSSLHRELIWGESFNFKSFNWVHCMRLKIQVPL